MLFNISKSYGNYDEAAIAVVSLKDHRTKILLEHAGMYPRYLRNGHLVYMTKGALFAAAFDLDRLEVRGNVKLLEQVLSNQNLGLASSTSHGTEYWRTAVAGRKG